MEQICGQRKGVALGFHLEGLRPSIEDETLVTFAPAIYDDALKYSLLSTTLKQFTGLIFDLLQKVDSLQWAQKQVCQWRILYPKKPILKHRSEFDRWSNERSLNVPIKREAARCAEALLRLCGLCKHSGFHEEKEWRLVLPLLKNSPKKPKYRTRKDKQVPYVEIALVYPTHLPFPLTEIMFAPGNLGDQAIPEHLSSVQITKSDIPLVVDS